MQGVGDLGAEELTLVLPAVPHHQPARTIEGMVMRPKVRSASTVTPNGYWP
jgi:hypothetical protein